MVLTSAKLAPFTYYVHVMALKYMRLRTTYFIYPHEYDGDGFSFDCVGLFAFDEKRTIIFAVYSDGAIKELTKMYFNQTMIAELETQFKKVTMA
jgi:hypothetical protein